MRRRTLRTHLRWLGAGALALAGLLLAATGAWAQGRPSLVDLDDTVGQVVDGLCGGDASQCGVEQVPRSHGRIEIRDASSASTIDLVDLDFTIDLDLDCTSQPACLPTRIRIRETRATGDADPIEASTLGSQLALQATPRLDVWLYNEELQQQEQVLHFDSVRLSTLEDAGPADRYVLGWETLGAVTFTWNGQSGGSCTFDLNGSPLVDLAGNPASVLEGEPEFVPAELGLRVSNPACSEPQGCPAPVAAFFDVERDPPSTCLLSQGLDEVRFRYLELWPLASQFSVPLVAREIRPVGPDSAQWMTRYGIQIREGRPREVFEVRLYGDFEVYTTTFDPATGNPVDQSTATVTFE